MKRFHPFLTFVFVPAFVTMLFSCSGNSSGSFPIPLWKLPKQNNIFSGERYFVGPTFDSSKVVIVADCDCCASDLGFINDSTFVLVSYCIDGDSYFSGTYCVFNDCLLMRFGNKSVSSTREISSVIGDSVDHAELYYETHNETPHYLAVKITTLKGKTVLNIVDEFAVKNEHLPLEELTDQIKSEDVWRKLGLK